MRGDTPSTRNPRTLISLDCLQVALQKIETAAKTGVLSLTGHSLAEVPPQVWDLERTTTLDLSKNNLVALAPQQTGGQLKTVGRDDHLEKIIICSHKQSQRVLLIFYRLDE